MLANTSTRRVSLHKQFMRQKLVVKLLTVFLAFLALLFFAIFILFAWYARDLPAPGKLSQATSASTVFYDRDNKVLFELSKDRNRVPVQISNISKYLKEGTVAIEDKNFYHHNGVSEAGIIRSALSILFKRQVQGGSTITQQLIKNVLLGSERSMSRKVKEIILASEVERRYSKDEILEMYLNEAPYGGSFWGVESAAMGYFGKPSKDLDLVQSAFLAGLPQSPSYYSPFIGKKDAWKGRTTDVLRRMREDHYITSKDEQNALKQLDSMKFSSPKLSINAPHFVFYVNEWLKKEYGEKILDQGLKVKTTLSLDIQNKTQQIVNEEVKKLKSANVDNGAAVVMDSKTGEILAMVGSYDFNDEDYGKFNVAVDGMRQPGSALKPITYATAFEKGYTPSTMLMDLKTTFSSQGGKDFIPVNYDGKFRGPVQLRFALGNSFNIPAVKLLAMIGVKDFLTKANDMGLSTLAPTQSNMNRFGLAITLGGGEVTLLDLTSAYSVFARGGEKINYKPILEVKDYKGKNLYKAPDEKRKQVVSPEATFLVSHILSDNVARSEAFGSSSYLRMPGKTVAVKTGTTDEKRDNWAIGFTKSVTVGVWVGNHDNAPMSQKVASGVTGASPIWNRIMTELLKKYSDGIMDKPDKVKSLEIDSFLGGLPKDGYPKRSEYFIDGTQPKDVSPFYKKIGDKDYIAITERDPVSTDGKNRWQDAIDEWEKAQGDEKYHAPGDAFDQDSVKAQIQSPTDHATVGNSVEFKIHLISVPAIKNVKIFSNNNELKSIDGDNKDIDVTLNLPNGRNDMKVTVTNDKGKSSDSGISIGVNSPWDGSATSPTSVPVPSPTP